MARKEGISRRRSKTGADGTVSVAGAASIAEVEGTQQHPLSKLHLSPNNPRLGIQAGQIANEVEVLDTIVNVFGIDDVLSSLAVNGYFEAEPMVGVRKDGTDEIEIAEGNRRLAACLILAGDKRARNQKKRTEDYQALQQKHNRRPITDVPVRVLTDTKSLLSYLGVRHIAASQPWDSYAKAAWVSKVLEESNLTLEDVSEMIGDQHQTVARALEGYYFVNQLAVAAQFTPGDSYRPGRGSNPAYPFSWVYTALGYGPIRQWLGMAESGREGKDKKPIKGSGKAAEAAELMVFLFGNRTKSRQPAISDSRQIADLARAVANTESLRLLKRGKTIHEVAQLLKPAMERVADSLLDAQESLGNALAPLSQGDVKAKEAAELLNPSLKVRNLANEVNSKIVSIIQDVEAK
ncbi:MAG: hypothetical protein GXY74_15345 [Phycisphaerae bacterium]|nr:hypothetical protein [Phycisphaerae bacterium]